jgi:hypothetical protein
MMFPRPAICAVSALRLLAQLHVSWPPNGKLVVVIAAASHSVLVLTCLSCIVVSIGRELYADSAGMSLTGSCY